MNRKVVHCEYDARLRIYESLVIRTVLFVSHHQSGTDSYDFLHILDSSHVFFVYNVIFYSLYLLSRAICEAKL